MDVYGSFDDYFNKMKNLGAASRGGGGLMWPDAGVWVAQTLLSSGVVILLLVAAFFCCGLPLLRRSVAKQVRTRLTVAYGPPAVG